MRQEPVGVSIKEAPTTLGGLDHTSSSQFHGGGATHQMKVSTESGIQNEDKDVNGEYSSDPSIGDSDSDSQESFHSIHEHDYLLSEDPSLSVGASDNVNVNDPQTIPNTKTTSSLMPNSPDLDLSDSGFVGQLRSNNNAVDHNSNAGRIASTHHANMEDEESFLEKQSFEEVGMVTLYSSMNGKSRRFHKSQYQGVVDGDTDGLPLDTHDEEPSNEFGHGTNQESCTDSKNVFRNKLGVSIQTMDTIVVGSECNGSSVGSDCLSMTTSTSPTTPNELRHRQGSGSGSDNTPPSVQGVNMLGDSNQNQNRMRSYTSPDTRSSIRNIVRNRQVRFQANRGGEQRPLVSSLDAGMTVLKRWVTTRSSRESPSPNPRPSRAARVQMQNYYFDNNTDSEVSLCEDQEDQFYPTSNGGYDNRQQASTSVGSRSIHDHVSVNSSGGSSDRTSTLNHLSFHSSPIYYPQTIQEEDDAPSRQRANSEPERSRNRHWRTFVRRWPEANVRLGGGYSSLQLPRNRPTRRRRAIDAASVESLESGGNSLPYEHVFSVESGDRPNRVTFDIESTTGGARRAQAGDPNREARRNWVLLNRRFQLVVILVGLTCSCLLFSILVTWVVLTSAYVVSIDEACDLPLKPYFWLATIQLILDVFRKEIMKFLFRFDPRSQQQIPTRVIVYNLAYLTYAMIVLRIGVTSVFLTRDSTCPETADNLFKTTRVFVTISVIAWLLILFGYLIPFCVVAILLTRNGYSPANEDDDHGPNFGVFPLPNTNNGAPPHCITLLKTVRLEDFGEDYPRECCICMSNFSSTENIVVTECDHIFHKGCCQEWLKQARTCPVCRTDIPTSLGLDEGGLGGNVPPNTSTTFDDGLLFSRGPFRSSEFQQDLENLVSLLRETNNR